MGGVGRKRLDDGSYISADDVCGSDAVDAFALQDRAPSCQVHAVRRAGRRLRELAVWIGRVTAIANLFPDPARGQGTRGRPSGRRPILMSFRLRRAVSGRTRRIGRRRRPIGQI